mgnify:CR=1 FL=1
MGGEGEDDNSNVIETVLEAFRKQEEVLRRLQFEKLSLQRAKRENVRLALESVPDEDVSSKIGLNLRVAQNMHKHNIS